MKEIFKALIQAQRSIGGIKKDKSNDFSNYKYASSENIVSVARKVLITNGLLVGRNSWTILPLQDSSETLTVRSTFFLSHPESGETIEHVVEFPAFSRKGSPVDKAVAGALTTCLAYWLRDILLLPRLDDPYEMNSRNDTNINYLNEKINRGDTK